MRLSTIGLRGLGLRLATVSAGLAAGPVAFEKHLLTDKYSSDAFLPPHVIGIAATALRSLALTRSTLPGLNSSENRSTK